MMPGGANALLSGAGGAAAYPAISSEHSRWRADQGITVATGVSQWDDISLVGDGDNDFVQADTAEQPSYNATGGPAGDGSMTFDGSNDHLRISSGMASLGQPLHYFLLAEQISFTATDVWIQAGPDSRYQTVRNNGASPKVSQDATGGAYSNHVSMTLGTFFLLDSFFSAGSSYQRLNNGSKVSSGNPGAGLSDTDLSFGAEGNNSNPTNFEVCEFIIFSAEVTGTDLTALMAYFSDRYGLF